MKISIGEIEIDNFIFFLITILFIVNRYFGFFVLLLYLLFTFLIKNRLRRIILPMLYLTLNTAIADYIIFDGIKYFQIFTFITFFLCILLDKRTLTRLINTLTKNLLMTALYFLLILLCIVKVGGIRMFFSLILMTLILLMIVDTENSIKDICDATLIAGNQIVYIGIIEFLLQHSFFYSIWAGSERYRYGILRIGSTVADPNYICLMLIPLMILSFYMSRKYMKNRYKRYFLMYGLICLITMSRTGWVCMGFAIFFILRKYYFKNMKRNLRFLINIGCIAICIMVIYGLLEHIASTNNIALMSSNFARSICIQYGIYLLTENLWSGIGLYNFYEFAQPMFYKDYGGQFAEGITVMNMPLEIGLAFGLSGLIIFILLNIDTCIKARKIKEFPGIEMIICFLMMSLTLDGMTIGLFWVLMTFPKLFSIVRK